jgi:hypothetical protein
MKEQAGFMEVSLDLPDDLLKEVKGRAVKENRKLSEVVAELLRKRLAASEAEQAGLDRSWLKKDRTTGLPLIECRRAATREISPGRAAQILVKQDIKWH